MRVSKADLHVHSRHSDRPSEWILRRLGAPECFTPPMTVYQTAKRRGMQFVTISDHNCIQGALEIAHLPGTFVSNEVTAYFPADRCKIHVLCWNITEAQFDDIQRLRENIVDLSNYFHANGIAHACAHPLYDINDRLTIGHFEELLLLFNVFETMNGGRNRRGNDLVRAILKSLTAEQIDAMANRHGIAPIGERPWVKGSTGGSDDHSGAFIAKGFTECPYALSPAEFLGYVDRRESVAGGLDGTPLSFAHSLYSIGYQYYRDRILSKSGRGSDPIVKMLGDVFGRAASPAPLRDRVSHFARRIAGRPETNREMAFQLLVRKEMLQLFGEDWLKDDFVATAERYEALNRRTFALASHVGNQLLFQFSKRFTEKLSSGSFFGSLEAVSAAGPVLLGVAPYLFSFAHQNRDRAFLADVAEHFLGRSARPDCRPKKAWFSDALTDASGAGAIVRQTCRLADLHQHDLTLISVSDTPTRAPGRVQHFAPVGTFTVPDAEGIAVGFPPFLDILDFCDRESFTELIVSTPGLSGLAAVAAGKLLKTRLVGVYHTDLARTIRARTEDEAMENATWRYLRWFYEQMDVILVPSYASRDQLITKGLDALKIQVCPYGTDLELFNPRHRDPAFWQQYGVRSGPTATYVGPLDKERDLDVLVDAYRLVARRRPGCTLAIVGDGPLLEPIKDALRDTTVVLTGRLEGRDLSRAYASSDLLVFPGTMDTFGEAVLEALASGIPAVVSDRGAACELVTHGRTGFVTKGRDVESLVSRVDQLLLDVELRRQMSIAARHEAESLSWENTYAQFWSATNLSLTRPADSRPNEPSNHRAIEPSNHRALQRGA